MKILIVDDHALFREGLCYVLRELEEGVIILEAGNYETTLQFMAQNPDLDLVLLDLNMPGKDGFSVLEASSEKYPAIPIAVLSASAERSDMQRVMDSGAMGYIPKNTTGKVLLNIVRMILSGGIYVPPAMVQGNDSAAAGDNSASLTKRQVQVLFMIERGLSNKLIAAELGVAEATIKMHITSIMKKLGVTNRTQAAMAAKNMKHSSTAT
jgi:DNA-binding NarL/FixJ family response regulator